MSTNQDKGMQRLRYSKYTKAIIIGIDAVIIACTFLFFYWWKRGISISDIFTEKNITTVCLLLIFWFLISGRTKLYSISRSLTYTNYLERLAIHILFFSGGVVLLTNISDSSIFKSERLYICLSLLLIFFVQKSGIFLFLKYVRSKGINHRNVMFIVETPTTEILREIFIKRKDYGYRIFNFPKEEINIQNLKNFWKTHGIHSIYIPSQKALPTELEKQIFIEAEKDKVEIILLPNIIQTRFFAYELRYIESLPVLYPAKFPLNYFANYTIKRTFDILFSLIILIGVCSWLFPIIALLIRLSGKGNIIFKQKRYGYREEVFNCYKFRTMKEDGSSTSKITEENDSRITPIGRFLRKTSLDELPQFINVLLGDMSVVGPRPHMLAVDDEFKPKIGRYSVRSLVKPGITGLAQVNGLRGDKGDRDIQMRKRVIADSFYVKNWSFSLDIIIILKTLILMIKGDKNAG